MAGRRSAEAKAAPETLRPARPANAHKRTGETEAIVRALSATAGVTHGSIARALGIAPKTLYAHYSDLLNHPGPGRPAHVPTPALRQLVANYKAVGLTDDEIAAVMEIDADTLRKHYRLELDKGAAIVTAKVGNRVIVRALGNGPEAQRASEFYLNGWKTRVALEASRTSEAAEQARTLVDGAPGVTRADARRVAFMLKRAALTQAQPASVVGDEPAPAESAPVTPEGPAHGV